MSTFLKNPEIKSILIKLLLLQLILAAFAFLFVHIEMININNEIKDRDYALIGKILYTHPELENEVIPLITKGASADEVDEGKNVLKKYGYGSDLPVYSQPVLKRIYSSFECKSVSFVLLSIIPFILLIMNEYNKIYMKIKKLTKAAEYVVEGNFDMELPENSEGDFAKLGHSFNMMTRQLKLSINKLHNDRVFLKNIISDISHQLKTPLSSMIVLDELLLENKNIEANLREDFLTKIKSQLSRMEWLISNLLKMAKLEAGAITFEKKQVLIKSCIKNAVENVIHKADEKGQIIKLSGDIESACFTGDEDWTAEAITNIIKNSIEHTGEGGSITINIVETPLLSSITIEDNGEGIDEKDIPHIFERFYQGSSSVKVESVGIGLSLAKLIVESQGGSIFLYSEKGKGTKFTINFLKGII